MNADAASSSKIKFGSAGVFSKLAHISSQSSAVSGVRSRSNRAKVLDELKIAIL